MKARAALGALALFGAALFGAALVSAQPAAPAPAPAVPATPNATAITLQGDEGAPLRLPRPAVRIVSLLPSLTETLCALQACELLVATDRHSNWPAEVRALPKLGGMEDLQVERLLLLKPDLVLSAGSQRALARLRELGVPVLVLEPRTLASTQAAMQQIAAAIGRPAAATAGWQALQQRLDAAAAQVPPGWRGQRVYFEVASEPYAAGESSFVGEVLARLGLQNIVPAALGPFPRLNSEHVLRAQPALLLATPTALAEMPARPGWHHLNALQRRAHCGFSPALFDAWMRPGPRLADAADALVECLRGLPPPAATVGPASGALPATAAR